MIDGYAHLDMTAADPIADLRMRMASAGVDRALIVETWRKDNLICLEQVTTDRPSDLRVARCFRPEVANQTLDLLSKGAIHALRVKTGDLRRMGRVVEWLEASGKWLLPHAESGIQALKDEILPIALAHPELRVYLPHLGWPARDNAADTDWLRSITELRDLRNIVVGISAIGHFSYDPYPHADVQLFVNVLWDLFGPDCLVAGSDYPLLPKDEYATYMRLAEGWISRNSAPSPSRLELALFD